MLCVVCCWLVDCGCSYVVVCCVFDVRGWSLFVVYSSLFGTHCLVFVVCRLSKLFVVGCSVWCVVRSVSLVACWF